MFTFMAQRLLKLRTFSVLLVVSILLFGCGKTGNYKWLHYDETYCADKWDGNINNEKLKDNVVAYLDKQGIKVYEIEIFSDRTPDACADCYCKSGRRIKCKVKKRDVKDIKKEGFYE